MGVIARLIHGGNILDLNDGSMIRLGTGYTPPSIGSVSSGGEGVFNHVIPLIVHGDTGGAVDSKIESINAFITSALSISEYRLYFEFKPFDGHDYNPLWGQVGGVKRIEIVDGVAQSGGSYHLGFVSGAIPSVVLSLTLKNSAEGLAQHVAIASGSVFDFRYGRNDKYTRGQALFVASTNLCIDPSYEVFGTSWAEGVGLQDSSAKIDKYIFDGRNSCYLQIDSTGADNTHTALLTLTGATTYCLQVMAKRTDGGAVTDADIKIYYDSDVVTSNYLEIGDGWYLVWATVTGTGASDKVGVAVYSDIYIDMYMVRASGALAWPFSGESIGSTWSSTAFDSSSTSTAPVLKIDTQKYLTLKHNESPLLYMPKGTIRATIRPLNNYNQIPFLGNRYIFDTSSGNFKAYWDGSNNWVFTDGTNTATSSADTFSANDTIVLYFVWGPNGLVIYKDGVSIGSDATFTIPEFGAYLFIGSDSSSATQLSAILRDFTIYGEELTATEVLADYNYTASLLGVDGALTGVPWMWTIGGDLDVDSDSGTAAYIPAATDLNCAILGGIGGTLPADIEFYGDIDAGVDVGNAYFCIASTPYYFNRTEWFYNGTPTVTATTIETNIASTYYSRWFPGKDIVYITRSYWTAAAKNIYAAIESTSASADMATSDVLSYTGAGASNYRVYTSPFVTVPKLARMVGSGITFNSVYDYTYKFVFTASTTPTSDYLVLMQRPFLIVPLGVAELDIYYIRGDCWTQGTLDRAYGDKLQLMPHYHNYLIFTCGNESNDPVSGGPNRKITFNDFFVVPRYAIL